MGRVMAMSGARTMMRSPRTPRSAGKSALAPSPAAIDDEIGARRDLVLAESHDDTGLLHLGQQKEECGIRVHMRFAGIIERRAEARPELRLECGERLAVEAVGALGHACEAVEKHAVARRRDDEASVRHQPRIDRLPKCDATLAEFADDGFGALFLAAGREHGAGIGAAAFREGRFRSLN